MRATFRSTTSRWSSRAGVSRSYTSRVPLPHDVELGLASQNPAHTTVRTELRVLFLGGADAMVVPLGHRGGRLQLDREPAVRHQRDVPALGNALLVVPQADQGSGAVAAVADGVGVDRPGDPGGANLRERGGEHLVPGAPPPHPGG